MQKKAQAQVMQVVNGAAKKNMNAGTVPLKTPHATNAKNQVTTPKSVRAAQKVGQSMRSMTIMKVNTVMIQSMTRSQISRFLVKFGMVLTVVVILRMKKIIGLKMFR